MLSHPAARLLLCIALAATTYAAAPSEPVLRSGLTLFVFTGSLWMLQALDLTVTAVLVPLAAVLAGVLSPQDALASFAHPVIFLFLGGFTLGAALQRHGLDRALAVGVLRLARGHRLVAVLLLFGLTAAVSMWISNTATTAMMLPLAVGLLRGDGTDGAAPGPREQAFVLLGLAYSASVGGIGTLVGSPPNAIAAAQAGISFAGWLEFGLPIVALLLPLMVVTLALVLRPSLSGRIERVGEAFQWTGARVVTVVIFALTAAGWIASAPLSHALGIDKDMDTIVALAAIVLLCATGTLGWRDVERGTQWGVLLLFGGGLALSQVMSKSGASRFLADQIIALVHGAPVVLLVLGVVAFVVMLTELVSNTAAAALLIPLFLGVGNALHMPPVTLAVAVAVSASCAFMLPVATPPNAIVFGTGNVPQTVMMRCGLVLNAVCIVVITAVMTFAH
jgi:sodium-dependent dicarboxylate transporter 2/3/5